MSKTLLQTILAAFCAILCATSMGGGGMRRRMMACCGNPNPYVTNGLIAMWDGEWNAGFGAHNSTATTWKDLVGGKGDMMVNYYPEGMHASESYWTDNALYFNMYTTALSAYLANFSNTDVFAVEAVFKGIGLGIGGMACGAIFSVYNGSGIGFASIRVGINGVGVGAEIRSATGATILPLNETRSVSLRRGVYMKTSASADFVNQNISQSSAETNSQLNIGNLAGIDRGGNAYLMNLRMYNREITLDEIAANYAVDQRRFGAT